MSDNADIREYIGGSVVYDNTGTLIWGRKGDEEVNLQRVLDIRGWGAIQNLFKDDDGGIHFTRAASFQDKLGNWIAEAINEKLARERAPEVVEMTDETLRKKYADLREEHGMFEAMEHLNKWLKDHYKLC